ncbi:MAG: hypothetical protein HQK62_06855 [Desulfamplus sp.]|nr:hypothetical protein [Desulfamplus sp.]
MLVDSFDKRSYAPTLSFEKKTDSGHKSFESVLQKSSKIKSSDEQSREAVLRRDVVANSSSAFSLEGTNRQIQIDNNPQDINNQSQKVHLGTISGDTPTVSELLYSTQYKKDCWEMLEKDVNSSKHFKRIPAGTDIYLDKKTSEIVWGENGDKKNAIKSGTLSGNIKDSEGSHLFFRNSKSKIFSKPFRNKDSVGRNYSTPELLIGSYSGHSENSGGISTYSSPNPGIDGSILSAKIYNPTIYNPEQDSYQSSVASNQSSRKSEPALNDAVREFMGKDYSKMDCYELVVGGLTNMGVKYRGHGGLGRHLIDKAISQGLSRNHYLTGEGLMAATGYSVYNKTVLSVKNPFAQAESVMKEMEKVLKEGQILSFSTRTRGHTGVISKKDGIWTFINSGYMDNNISGKNGIKQVGEEILSKELENWFKLAVSRKDGLKITLGNIDIAKLATYREDKTILSKMDKSRLSKKV